MRNTKKLRDKLLNPKGQTRRQVLAAKKDAVYIVRNQSAREYTFRLAHYYNRHDLEIVTPNWLAHGWLGRHDITDILIDHATELTSEQWRKLYEALKARPPRQP